MGVQTYWLDQTDKVIVGLRRYARREHTPDTGWTCADGWHQAMTIIGVEEAVYRETDEHRHLATREMVDHADPRWPTACEEGCGYEFADDDEWQVWQEQVYQRADNGEYRRLGIKASPEQEEVPRAEPGACWDAWWMPSAMRRPDGLYLMVRLPDDSDWAVDSQASNCTRPGEPHECWVRHGDPRECKVTVDKNGPNTCSAGAGSIASANWHGFLTNGELVG